MRLETKRKIHFIVNFMIFPLIIYNFIKLYVDGNISLIVMILIIIISTIIFILVITYISKYFRKKIERRKTMRLHGFR